MKKRILLLGADGMFGKDAQKHFLKSDFEVIPADIPEVDITEASLLEKFFSKVNPQIVINAAAFTDVDGAEDRKEDALRINAKGAKNVAEVCKFHNSFLIQISTDYVFPGKKKNGYLPEDETGPAANYYGETKLLGEKAILETLSPKQFLICRTQWLYGKNGKNFVKTIVRMAKEKKEIEVVNDQWGVPTWTNDLAEQIGYLIKINYAGFAHTVGGGGPITWFQFAKDIVETAKIDCKVNPITSDKLQRKAKRPQFGFLKNETIPNECVRNYKESLKMYLEEENFL